MILFDLRCPAGHIFEGWFGSGDAYEDQRARGLLACPICGAAGIEKAVMAPAVGAKGNRQDAARGPAAEPAAAALPMAAGQAGEAPAKMKALMQALARAQAELLARSEHVGRRFADEARAIHLGEAEARPIHGQASIGEARALIDEGIAVAPLPLPLRDRASEN